MLENLWLKSPGFTDVFYYIIFCYLENLLDAFTNNKITHDIEVYGLSGLDQTSSYGLLK